MATRKLTTVVIDALEDIKARDINLINVSRLTSVFDYIAVASADSTRQTKALAKHVMDKVKEAGGWIYGIEGEQSGEWVLVDCGDVVVHIMQPVMREHYKLEELWGDGKLEYPKPAAPRRAPPTRPAPKVTTAKKKPGTTAKATGKKTPAAKPKGSKPATTRVAKATTTKSKAGTVSGKAKVTRKAKVVAASGAAKQAITKPATPVRKKVTATTLKKTAVKKPVAKKPVARRRKVAEE